MRAFLVAILIVLVGNTICCKAESAESSERPRAIARSLLIPGWGQLSAGENTKGIAFLSLGVSALATSIYYGHKGSQYYDTYQAAVTPEAAKHYRELTIKSDRNRNIALIFYGLNWVLNAYDITKDRPDSALAQSSCKWQRLRSPSMVFYAADPFGDGNICPVIGFNLWQNR